MQAPSPAHLFRRWFQEIWNERNPAKVAELFAADGISYATDESSGDIQGVAAYQAFLARYLDSFTEIEFTILDVIESGDMAAGRWRVSMRHSGDALGIPATGKAVTVTGMSISRFRDGQLVEGWNEWDRLALATALGLR